MPRIVLIIIAAALLITLFAGCRQPEPTLKAPGDADVIAENLLQAFAAVDYVAYLDSFDVPVADVMSQDWFMQTASLVQSRVGSYVAGSKEVYEIKPDAKNEQYTDVIYKTDFSDEPDGVYVTVAFIVSDNHTSPEGIWFSSPKLFEP